MWALMKSRYVWLVIALTTTSALCADDTQSRQKWLHDFSGPGEISCQFCHLCEVVQTDLKGGVWSSAKSVSLFSRFEATNKSGWYGLQISQVCLGCHEGLMAPEPPLANDPMRPIWDQTSITKYRGNHHPYAVVYDPIRMPSMADTRFVKAAGLPLFRQAGGSAVFTVECPTCHEVHQAGPSPLLRLSAGNKVLCFVCHRAWPGTDSQALTANTTRLAHADDCRACHQDKITHMTR